MDVLLDEDVAGKGTIPKPVAEAILIGGHRQGASSQSMRVRCSCRRRWRFCRARLTGCVLRWRRWAVRCGTGNRRRHFGWIRRAWQFLAPASPGGCRCQRAFRSRHACPPRRRPQDAGHGRTEAWRSESGQRRARRPVARRHAARERGGCCRWVSCPSSAFSLLKMIVTGGKIIGEKIGKRDDTRGCVSRRTRWRRRCRGCHIPASLAAQLSSPDNRMRCVD